MKDKKTIFQTLIDEKICFAVCVSMNTFKVASLQEYSKDYFLIIKKSYFKKHALSIKKAISSTVFKQSSTYPTIMELDMDIKAIDEFKNNQNTFVKVKHNEFGRVYELKNNSFKSKFNYEN